MKGTSCRSSRSRLRIGPRCSSRSSNATARAASAPETSSPCSRRSNANRHGEAISYELLLPPRTDSAQAAHAVSAAGWLPVPRRGDGHPWLHRRSVAALPFAAADRGKGAVAWLRRPVAETGARASSPPSGAHVGATAEWGRRRGSRAAATQRHGRHLGREAVEADGVLVSVRARRRSDLHPRGNG